MKPADVTRGLVEAVRVYANVSDGAYVYTRNLEDIWADVVMALRAYDEAGDVTADDLAPVIGKAIPENEHMQDVAAARAVLRRLGEGGDA